MAKNQVRGKYSQQNTTVSFWVMVCGFTIIIVSPLITNNRNLLLDDHSINDKVYADFEKGHRLDIQVQSDLPWHCFPDEVFVDDKKFSPTDFIFPGKHKITLRKKGYEELNLQVNVPEGLIPFCVKATLISKPRPVTVKVVHDFMIPGDNFKPKQLTLGKQELTAQEKFKPGFYELVIAHPGFITIRERVIVYPGEGMFELEQTIYAKPRVLMWDIPQRNASNGCNFLQAEQVLVNGKIAMEDTAFMPGVKYHFVARFIQYKTMDKMITIEPGEGPYLISVEDLVAYKKYHLRIGKKYHEMTVDKIEFPIKIFINGNLLEPHHLIPGDGFNLINYDFYAPKNMRFMRIACGFYYDESLAEDTFEFRHLRKIDPSLLLEHLQRLPKPSSALHSVSRLLEDRQDKQKIQSLSKKNRQRIVNLLRSLTLSEDQQIRREKVIEKLLMEK